MSEIAQYLLSIVSVALIVSLSNTFMEKKSTMGSILKLVTGLVLAVVIVSPWSKIELNDLQTLYSHSEIDASDLVNKGQQIVSKEISSHIKEQIQTYILDKASALDLEINTDVILTDKSPPTIDKVRITGAASPYAKQCLLQILYKDLSISKECLEWS